MNSDKFIQNIKVENHTTSKPMIKVESKFNKEFVEVGDCDDSSIEIVEVVKKPSAKFQLDQIVQKMHERVIQKARKKLTNAIQRMMITKRRVKETVLDRNNTANICDDENDKNEKISTVELKSIIMKLEESENDGKHKSVILNVTDNGKQLMKSNSNCSLSSDEMLDRFVFYHEMEDMDSVPV